MRNACVLAGIKTNENDNRNNKFLKWNLKAQWCVSEEKSGQRMNFREAIISLSPRTEYFYCLPTFECFSFFLKTSVELF